MAIIDFHTHAFPDQLADRAIAQLESECDEAQAHTDGRVSSLIESMDRNGIDRSVVLSIATKPSQFDPILNWSTQIRSHRIEPFPSVHPDDPDAISHIESISSSGFKGIKLHPYYQRFTFDEERMYPLYEAMMNCDLILLTHAGFDIAYDRYRIVDPQRILHVHQRFPDLTIVASHFGAWEDWDMVAAHLAGTGIFLDTSYTLHLLQPAQAVGLINQHGADRILFGTDSPWEDQEAAIRQFRNLGLPRDVEEQILYGNADRLLSVQ